MRWIRDYTPDPMRLKRYRQALVITLAGNLLLAAGKGVVAYLSKSVALYADAANSASDVFYSLTMVLGLWMAQRPPDMSHPQGHSRFEPLVGLVIAGAMTFAGYEAARAAVERLVTGAFAVEPGWPTLALLIGAGVKGVMFVLIRRIAAEVSSSTLAIVAQDNLSDVLTSGAAFVGTLGSAFIHPLTDPIAGILVSLWIFRAAFGAWKENLSYLTGAGAAPELRKQIADVAASVDGVAGVHQVIAEYVGPRLVADLHIDVDSEMPLYEAHRIADQVQERIETLQDVDRAYVHVEPFEEKNRTPEEI